MQFFARTLSFAAIVAVLFAAAAPSTAAPIPYGDFIGPNLDFIGVTEDSITDPNVPLFGGVLGPLHIGNQLLWFPTAFAASSVDGTPDQTNGLLQMTLMAKNGETIDEVKVTEFGDWQLSGDPNKFAQATISGLITVTVLETLAGPIAPVVLFAPGVGSPDTVFDLGVDPLSGAMMLTMEIDVDAVVPNATKVLVNLNNNLAATSEAGTSSFIQKKVIDGPVVIVEAEGPIIPEPASLLLLVSGIVGLAGMRWRRAR